MELPELNDTIELLNTIKATDLSTVALEDLLKLFSKLNKHVAVVTVVPAGTVVSRSVSCNYLKGKGSEIPLLVSDISFNPNLNVCGFNRATWEGKTAFYGSVSSQQLESYYTCGFEVLSDLKESEKEIDRETFVTGKWIVKKDLQVVHISGNLKHNVDQVSQRYDALYHAISQYPEHIVQLKMIDSMLTAEFSKSVASDARWNYKISAAYAEFIKQDGWPGVLFPSVQADGAGTNIAIFPDRVDEYLELERAALTVYYKRSDSFVNEYVMEAFPEGNTLKWNETYIHKLPPMIRRWYTGLSDDNSFNRYIAYEDL